MLHQVGEIYQVEQRDTDGFINGTAMCVAHGKKVGNWLKSDEAWDLVTALADELGIENKCHFWGNSVYTRVSDAYPELVVTKQGSPANGGGVWLHPDLAIQLAQWCSPKFALQVSRWVREWMMARTVAQPKPQRKLQDWRKSRSFARCCHKGFEAGCWRLGLQPWVIHDELTRLTTGHTAAEHRQLTLIGDDRTVGLDHVASSDALELIGIAKQLFVGYRKGTPSERLARAVSEAKAILGYDDE